MIGSLLAGAPLTIISGTEQKYAPIARRSGIAVTPRGQKSPRAGNSGSATPATTYASAYIATATREAIGITRQ
jgi:hypothetical protein